MIKYFIHAHVMKILLCIMYYILLVYFKYTFAWICNCLQLSKQSSKGGNKQRLEKQQGSSSASTKKAKSRGFKNDVRAALSVLKHKFRMEQKQVKRHIT